MHNRFLLITALLVAVLLSGCGQREAPTGESEPGKGEAAPKPPRTVFVHLFEWDWPSVATECEQFLGPAGYAAVQVSPPQEHAAGPQWYMRYQPVSYQLESRGGTRDQFVGMVERCKAAGVDIYVDAVLNHMTGVYVGTSVVGTEFGEYEYPGLYGYDDFNHCGRNENDDIVDFDDAFEIHNCELVNLADLATAKPEVQEKLAGYLNDLVSVGVAGFRLDAAKHMPADDIGAILAMVDGDPYVFQEVIAGDDGPIDRSAYAQHGDLTEFGYAPRLEHAFLDGNLGEIRNLEAAEGLFPSEQAVVFVDNHDTQRGHWGEGLNFTAGERYALANVFMLAWPYGYPKVMSSYEFEDKDQGAPETDPVSATTHGCAEGWVCEHRWPAITGMVKFRNATVGEPVTHWQDHGAAAISFGRGDIGHVVINAGEELVDVRVRTDLAAGEYSDLLAGDGGRSITVDANGYFEVSLEPITAVAILDR